MHAYIHIYTDIHTYIHTYIHDKVAKVIYDAMIDHKNQKKGIVEIYSEGKKEIWWDKKITIPPLKHNKPGILYWNKHNNICFIINIAVGLGVNITKKH